MDLPVLPPVEPMLAKLRDDIPTGEGWLYEPKWDGFRAIVFRDGDDVHVASRDRKPLERYFPELVAPLHRSLPARCVVDGEVVITGSAGLDFDALLLRIHPAKSRIDLLAKETPGSFVAFDLLALNDTNLMEHDFSARREQLERALARSAIKLESTRRGGKTSVPGLTSNKPRSDVFLTPQTADAEEARAWFAAFEDIGLDGIIAKRTDQHYVPGQRVMMKIKNTRTADCVVGGYRLSKTGDGIGSLLLGVYDDTETLHYVGHTSSFKAPERRALLEQMRKLEGGVSFGGGRSPGGPSRWTGKRDVSWTPVRPELVCEVRYDHMQGDRFRHAATFLRWRADRDPLSCTFDQLSVK